MTSIHTAAQDGAPVAEFPVAGAYPPASGRTLALVDYENLRGGTHADAPWGANDVALEFGRVAGLADCDHIVVGSGPRSVYSAAEAFPRARRVFARGVNGADHALLHASADVEQLARSYDRVIIGSGDGIFTERVGELQRAGLEVGLVARPGTVSRRLHLATNWTRYLPADRDRAVPEGSAA